MSPRYAPSPSPFRSSEARERERALKREALLSAAVRMFNERGFHATSLDDVAASLGVTKPLIYHYLGNKDQVLLECVRFGLDQLREAAAAVRGLPGTGLDRLRIFLRRYAEVTMGDFGRCVVRTQDQALSPESRTQFRALKRDIDRALLDMIRDAVADGSAVTTDVRMAGRAIAGALNGAGHWFRDDGDLPLEEVARRLVEALCAGLLPR